MEPLLTPLLLKNFLTVVENSLGTTMFQKLYFKKGEETIDILRNGDLSCGFFVSSILKMFSLIDNIHATVNGTVHDMKKSGWEEISKPKPGAIIVWGLCKTSGNEFHRHIGFYTGNNQAISNSSNKQVPSIHGWDYRPVEHIFWHKKLGT